MLEVLRLNISGISSCSDSERKHDLVSARSCSCPSSSFPVGKAGILGPPTGGDWIVTVFREVRLGRIPVDFNSFESFASLLRWLMMLICFMKMPTGDLDKNLQPSLHGARDDWFWCLPARERAYAYFLFAHVHSGTFQGCMFQIVSVHGHYMQDVYSTCMLASETLDLCQTNTSRVSNYSLTNQRLGGRTCMWQHHSPNRVRENHGCFTIVIKNRRTKSFKYIWQLPYNEMSMIETYYHPKTMWKTRRTCKIKKNDPTYMIINNPPASVSTDNGVLFLHRLQELQENLTNQHDLPMSALASKETIYCTHTLSFWTCRHKPFES